jgi:hypothetical protein
MAVRKTMPLFKGFKIEGIGNVLKANGKAREKDAIAIDEGLAKCAEILLRASQKLVPVKTGYLKSTGRVEQGKGVGMAASAAVIYDAPYAIYVHENMEARHASPTQAKFLSDAVIKVRGTMTAVLKRQLTSVSSAS